MKIFGRGLASALALALMPKAFEARARRRAQRIIPVDRELSQPEKHNEAKPKRKPRKHNKKKRGY